MLNCEKTQIFYSTPKIHELYKGCYINNALGTVFRGYYFKITIQF